MYLIKTKQVIHVFALAVILTIMFGIYCVNIIDEKFSDTIYSIKTLFTPQINTYGNYKIPYFY